MTAPLPVVAIVGRPNVGKSTLFNRYAGTRRAIVEDRPGITRDRIHAVVEVARPGGEGDGDAVMSVLLVDTAGLDRGAEGDLEGAVQDQARVAVDQADAILFLVDGKAGLLPEDEEIARELRRAPAPVALVVNKIDRPEHEERVGEFHQLGFERTWSISAEHGGGAWDALEELVATLPATAAAEQRIAADYRVALVGRPNVGKSSLFNRLVGAQRAVVSAEGGTTRDAIDTRVERDGEVFEFVDTAGLRRGARRDRVGERVSALLALRAMERAEVVLVLADAAEGITDRDLNIVGRARDQGRAVGMVLNKWDTIHGPEASAHVSEEAKRGLRFAADVPLLRLSALTGSRVERVFDMVRSLAAAARLRVPTAELNRWLAEATEAHEPAMAQRGARRRPTRFFYATQVGICPPSFVLFCSDPRAVRASYRRYLENRLRERFGMAGSPVRIVFRSRRPDAE